MPFPLIPVINAAATLASQGIAGAQARRQQEKANEYNETMWHKQNEYNTPENQMQRFKEAGLNPNLIYGQGNAGNAAPAPQFEKLAPEGIIQPNATPMLDNFVDYQIKKAQLDNLRTQNTVMEQDALLRTAQVFGARIGNQSGMLNLSKDSELYQTSIDAAKENVRKMRIDANYTQAQNIRADIDSQNRTAETVERILTSQLGRQEAAVRMQNLMKEGRIKEFEAKLADMGISPSAPYYYKTLVSLLKKYLPAGALDDYGIPK
ncbi:MAG: DNA pilot protein [Wigfec virus K19_165]|nr:MAG: DNA pilot protein [Wigfec virus K19_165]